MNDATHSTGLRVLVVDDHLASRLYTVAALRQIGAAVKARGSAEAALDAALRWRPDALVTDLHLPGFSGHELIRRIRQHWPGQRPPPRMIVLSADPDSPPGTEAAADAILAKPATPAQLRAALHGVVAQRAWPDGTRGAGVREIGFSEERAANNEDPQCACGPQPDELQRLFRGELAAQMPALEASLAARDLRRARDIVHQLLASSRLCGERRLELCLQALHADCRKGAPTADVACGYYRLLAAAAHYLESAASRCAGFPV